MANKTYKSVMIDNDLMEYIEQTRGNYSFSQRLNNIIRESITEDNTDMNVRNVIRLLVKTYDKENPDNPIIKVKKKDLTSV